MGGFTASPIPGLTDMEDMLRRRFQNGPQGPPQAPQAPPAGVPAPTPPPGPEMPPAAPQGPTGAPPPGGSTPQTPWVGDQLHRLDQAPPTIHPQTAPLMNYIQADPNLQRMLLNMFGSGAQDMVGSMTGVR
jgi:hypothetical protein